MNNFPTAAWYVATLSSVLLCCPVTVTAGSYICKSVCTEVDILAVPFQVSAGIDQTFSITQRIGKKVQRTYFSRLSKSLRKASDVRAEVFMQHLESSMVD